MFDFDEYTWLRTTLLIFAIAGALALLLTR